MWCDNCLLLLPLRAGAIAWALLIMLYSIAGGVILFKWGPFVYFLYPEWQIYGGISIAIAAAAAITILALANRSYTWVRASRFIWPFVIIISAVRAIIMIVELQRGKDNIQWECANGQIWPASAAQGYEGTTSFPNALCRIPFANLDAAVIISLLVDLGFQIYLFFMNWRYQKRIEHYQGLKGPFGGGYYNS